VNIASTNAGPASITAAAGTPGGPSSQIDIEFVAVEAASLILQASPAALGVNQGDSDDQQSIITAIVRDTSNNLVKNQTVSFSIFSDVSGGGISPPSAITDSFGRASTVYTAGAVPSAQDGVLIDAQAVGTGPCTPTAPRPRACDRVNLSVARQSLFITLGTGNEIFETRPTNYEMPFKAIVTDANSNPVAGVRVELNLTPLRYFKGTYVEVTDVNGGFLRWGTAVAVRCTNEDILTGEITKDRNGILDGIDEDLNGDGVLQPGNVATLPAFVTTDATGIAEFRIDYPQDHANWVEVELEARTSVAGSESAERTTFILPVLADDVDDRNNTPPGFTSPFGVSASCTDAL
jgi:adhesin/invasin